MKGPPRRATQRRPAHRSAAARLSGIFGELLLTAAVILALFLTYSLWWTNVKAAESAESTAHAIRIQWEETDSSGMPPGSTKLPGIGFLHVPALGNAGEIAVVEGTDPDRLNEGVAGYYTSPTRSAMPWDKEGNFALAAHRDGHGAKFHNLDKVAPGDPIVVETKDAWYIYTAFAVLPQTNETDTGVIDPVPLGSGRHTRGKYITLTTCTPVLTSNYRLIVWGELTRVEAVDADRTPPSELSA